MEQVNQKEWVRKIDDLDRTPISFRATQHKMLRIVLIGIVFIIAGIFAIRQSGMIVVGLYFVILGVLACLVASMAMVLPPRLKLTTRGFEMISFLRTYKRSWDDIEHFFLRRKARAPTAAAFNLKGRTETAWQNFNRGFGGADGILPNVYDPTPDDMVTLLEAARERWSSKRSSQPNGLSP